MTNLLDKLEKAADKLDRESVNQYMIMVGGNQFGKTHRDYINLANPETIAKLVRVARAAEKYIDVNSSVEEIERAEESLRKALSALEGGE